MSEKSEKPQLANDPLYPKDPTVTGLKAADEDKHKGGQHDKSEPAHEKKPANVTEECAALSARLDQAVSAQDAAKIEECWKEMDGLYARKGSGAEKHEIAALSQKFAHLAPRALPRVKAIEAALDAGMSDKLKAPRPKVEHPAVTKAKADLAALQHGLANHVLLPEDARAIKALEDKIASIPLVEAP